MIERAPVEAAYRGRQVLTNPPPSSGGILIAYALDLLEHWDLRCSTMIPMRSRCSPR